MAAPPSRRLKQLQPRQNMLPRPKNPRLLRIPLPQVERRPLHPQVHFQRPRPPNRPRPANPPRRRARAGEILNPNPLRQPVKVGEHQRNRTHLPCRPRPARPHPPLRPLPLRHPLQNQAQQRQNLPRRSLRNPQERPARKKPQEIPARLISTTGNHHVKESLPKPYSRPWR